jgi:hypothetical protein
MPSKSNFIYILTMASQKKHCFRAPKMALEVQKDVLIMKNFQDKLVGIGGWLPISTWKMCRDSGQPRKCRTHNYKEVQKNVLN